MLIRKCTYFSLVVKFPLNMPYSSQVARANWTLYTSSAPSLQLPHPPLYLFHRYRHDSKHHLLSNLDAMAERGLHRLTVYVRQRYDRCGSEHGRH